VPPWCRRGPADPTNSNLCWKGAWPKGILALIDAVDRLSPLGRGRNPPRGLSPECNRKAHRSDVGLADQSAPLKNLSSLATGKEIPFSLSVCVSAAGGATRPIHIMTGYGISLFSNRCVEIARSMVSSADLWFERTIAVASSTSRSSKARNNRRWASRDFATR